MIYIIRENIFATYPPYRKTITFRKNVNLIGFARQFD